MHCESSRQLGFVLSYTPLLTLKRRKKNSIYGNLECLFRLDYTGRTACTEPQCLYKGDLYLTIYVL
jgi:hypothetical protein